MPPGNGQDDKPLGTRSSVTTGAKLKDREGETPLATRNPTIPAKRKIITNRRHRCQTGSYIFYKTSDFGGRAGRFKLKIVLK
jgi:hypothetical protein